MKRIFLGIALLTLVGCAKKTTSTEVVVESPTETVEVTEFIEEEEIIPQRTKYNESEAVLTDLIHTRLDVNFIWEESRMNETFKNR